MRVARKITREGENWLEQSMNVDQSNGFFQMNIHWWLIDNHLSSQHSFRVSLLWRRFKCIADNFSWFAGWEAGGKQWNENLRLYTPFPRKLITETFLIKNSFTCTAAEIDSRFFFRAPWEALRAKFVSFSLSVGIFLFLLLSLNFPSRFITSICVLTTAQAVRCSLALWLIKWRLEQLYML